MNAAVPVPLHESSATWSWTCEAVTGHGSETQMRCPHPSLGCSGRVGRATSLKGAILNPFMRSLKIIILKT